MIASSLGHKTKAGGGRGVEGCDITTSLPPLSHLLSGGELLSRTNTVRQ
jgi:hypothetical protein